uniref:potassium voltage-gated channel subfamily KQT member 5-like isoform X10 n=1 Tax=Anopheles coluzzii TaxID=1518534 RepID=UPI0020FFC8D0|nr:potassium voltage-gated channel subfamily KQT member 5-like isoform X10 [Anopheles coluzzii]
MASRKTSTVSDSGTIFAGGRMHHRDPPPTTAGVLQRRRDSAASGNCSNEHNQNSNDHRRTRQEPHFPQIKIVIDEPERPALKGGTGEDAALALHTLRRHSARRHGTTTKGLSRSAQTKPTTGSVAFLTIYDSRAGERRASGASCGSGYFPDSREDLRSYVADYGDEDDDDYGIDTDGRYRLQRRRVSRGSRNEYDGEEVEEDEEEDEMEQDIDGEDDEEEDDEDEDNGRDYHSACKLSDKNRADRLARPRMSLLGKPLNYNRGSRRDARYRRLQSRVYNFLERPRGFKAIFYHVCVFLMVFTCLALSVFSTIQEYEDQAIAILFVMEIIVVIWFSIEFFLRLWSSGCRSRYQGAVGRLKFLKRPFCIIDIVTIAASIVVLVMGTSGQVFATSALRGLRFFQILRMVRMDRRGGTWKLLGSVVYAHRQELITTLYIGFLGLIFASFLVYLMEKDVRGTKFSNFAQALWWGVITLCTVGYGDMVPETWQGKIIASFCALLGISFFALPAGILGSGFALKVQQQQRQKHMIRRRQPAATLIQSLWRCYAADEHSMSEATWKIHQVPLPSPPPSFRGQKIYLLARRCPSATERSKLEAAEKLAASSSAARASSSFKHNASFVARLPTIRRHKSQSLHSPGNPKPPSGGSGRTGRCPRVTDINASSENLVTNNGRPMNPSLSEDSVAETALSKKNSDDEDEEPRCVQLTNQHKGAIRFIRKMKYFVARRKFKEALKPYDVKDVMEQYAAGHVDLLGRVKNVQTRLDQILGKQGSKSKDVYASKISLASRVVKIERQVDDIETKVDSFIDLYMQDRMRLLSLPLHPDTSHSNNPNLPSLPPKGGGASAVITSVTTSSSGSLKPKPILVDKQFSEPNSPIAKTFEEQPLQQKRPPMQRGFSDLGHRIKKRVTLSSIPPQYVGNSTGQPSDRGDVVIVVPNIDAEHLEPVGIEELASVCIDTEIEIEPGSPKTITESSIIMMDEEDDEEDEEEDIEEEDLDIGAEIDPDSPPWDVYGDMDVEDQDDTTENTALLRTAAKTEIIVTPISPVSSAFELNRMDSEEYRRSKQVAANNNEGEQHQQQQQQQQMLAITGPSGAMDSLKPERASNGSDDT